ncbi:MAG: DNA mismatch repair endonuclease MutL [Spirochaetes bacterium]|nr:DNA mismatch repair endonuclease MutL [Spirochaetota bacterium]
MKRIRVLPDSVKNKIAAGEVIEGPFSVVKELLENALDAGASRIEVKVEEAGLRRILVRDDGEGIPAKDLPLAVVEHATSKIDRIEDIERIGSYGFRGEALSSMAAVSELTILSRTRGEETGARLEWRGGEASVQGYAGPAGTTVIVENLFYNIPARKKFLKSRSTEARYLREAFLRAALPHQDVEFSLETDGRRAVTLVPSDSMDERIAAIYGTEAAESLFREELQDLKVKLTGYLSMPHYMKSSRSMQLLYVNRRPVEYRYLGMLLSRAYEAVSRKGEHPAALIFIEIDPSLVDVNIHPAKREVKFFDQRYLDGLIFSLARKGLSGPQRMPGGLLRADGEVRRAMEVPVPDAVGAGDREAALFHGGGGFSAAHGGAPAGTVRSLVRESAEILASGGERSFTLMGVAFGTYCVVEAGEALHVIDIHAAHERVIYDSLMRRSQGREVQELLFPKVVQLSAVDHAIVMDNLEGLESMGFRIEDFSDGAVVIRGVPMITGAAVPEKMLEEFISAVKEERPSGSAESLIAASVACHSAWRAGDLIPSGELAALVESSLEEGREKRCPHGRPYLYTVHKNDLERMFKRQ